MLIITSPCSSAKRRRAGARRGSPASSTISAIAPTGSHPARRASSTAASVCPGRSRTPPVTARSGRTWPGRVRSAAEVPGWASSRAVRARSRALIPVDTPTFASHVTV